ncbi:glycosyltransferase family 8 protein [Snodgrassella gandavensis]|uniref:glycosyltransferase family 8 protein n=1 Tax=Snodgrassella gandavensis TaxID=2946698 RepID=UPI001EF63112|nr:glycosyltransferase family 8 protein [Snodgrassella gandavensis]
MELQNRQTINIFLSSDDNYAKYIPVLLESIYCTASADYDYKVTIADANISDNTKNSIANSSRNYSNFIITYVDINNIVNKYKDLFVTFAHFTVSTYIRFFIPDILPDVSKAIYLDIDLLIKSDISKLYEINIDSHIVAAAVDACYARELYYNKNNAISYSEKILGLPKGVPEFNAGVLLINLNKWREENITQKCIEKLADIGRPRVLDQCILNAVIEQDYIYKLPVEWNYVWHAQLEGLKPITKSSVFNEVIKEYNDKIDQIKIIHYTSSVKPWNIYSSHKDIPVIRYLAEDWWRIASKTGIFTQLLASSQSYINTQDKKSNLNCVKRIYFFNLRFFKIKQLENCKTYYLFNIPILRVKTFF